MARHVRISMKWGFLRMNGAMAPSTTEACEKDRGLESERAIYAPPELRALGDIRDMTMGGSLGTGDSGSAAIQRF